MVRWAFACGLLVTACGIDSHEVDVQPGESIKLDDVNGDVGCEGGTLYLPATTVINGSLDATNCVLKVMGLVNGSITASGGVVHVIDALSVNCSLDVSDAAEVIVSDSDFNGGAEIENTAMVRILGSSFNGDGGFVSNAFVEVADASFNGSLEIRGSDACLAENNRTNGSQAVGDCDGS